MIFSIFYWENACSHLCFTSLNMNVEHNVFYFPLEIHVLIFVSPFSAWSLFIKKEYGVMVWWIRNIKTYDPAYCLLLIKISIHFLACHPQPRYLFGTDKCFVLTCFFVSKSSWYKYLQLYIFTSCVCMDLSIILMSDC